MAAKHLRKLVIIMGEETMTFRSFYLAIVLRRAWFEGTNSCQVSFGAGGPLPEQEAGVRPAGPERFLGPKWGAQSFPAGRAPAWPGLVPILRSWSNSPNPFKLSS